MVPERGLRERKNAEVKRAFFEAAMALFRQKGVERTSVDEIAERAGFSRATYFNHFGTKEGVLRYYGQRLQERMEELLAEAAPGASPLERIREMLHAMAREADRCRDDLKIVYLHSLRDPDYFTGPTSARQRVFEMVCNLVAKAQGGGEIRQDLSAREIAFHLMSLYNGAVLAVVSGVRPAEAMLRSAWLLIVDGVRGGDLQARRA
ncbi:MAG: TetR/AcrR family transcriptional regulator [Acidobacteriota bacterium]